MSIPIETDIPQLFDIQAANVEVRERQRQTITEQAMSICGATSSHAFLNAVEWYQDAIRELEARGYCLACGKALVAETVCVRCGRDNS
jgi:hypothetical protein